MDRRWVVVIAALALLVGVWQYALFTLPVWMQAVVVQLGNPVRTVTEPGLYAKVPFIQQVLYFDRRLLDQSERERTARRSGARFALEARHRGRRAVSELVEERCDHGSTFDRRRHSRRAGFPHGLEATSGRLAATWNRRQEVNAL